MPHIRRQSALVEDSLWVCFSKPESAEGFNRKKRIERACSLLYDPVHIPDTGGESCDCGAKTYDGKSENR